MVKSQHWWRGQYSSVVGLPVMYQPDPGKNARMMAVFNGTKTEAETNAALFYAAVTATHEVVSMGYDPIKLVENLPVLVLSLECWANGRTPKDIAEGALLINFANSIATDD